MRINRRPYRVRSVQPLVKRFRPILAVDAVSNRVRLFPPRKKIIERVFAHPMLERPCVQKRKPLHPIRNIYPLVARMGRSGFVSTTPNGIS